MPKKYIPVQFAPRIYAEWGELISDLSDSDKARIFEAIIKYPNIELDSGVWRFIKSQLEKDYQAFLSKCAGNKEKAKNYWGITKENKSITTAIPSSTLDSQGITKENQGEPKHKQETETKTEIKEKNIKKENRFVKPSLDEIKAYCIERGNNVNPAKFFDFYESKGWKVGKNPMKNWQASVRTWERNSDNSTSDDIPLAPKRIGG